MNEISNHFEAAVRNIDQILSQRSFTDNPLEIRLHMILKEEREMLEQARTELATGEPDWKQLREFITIAYHDDEIADPTFRAWKRACLWMKTVDPETLDSIECMLGEIRKSLDKAVPIIQKVYGLDDTRYIIPNVFRAEAIQQEEG